jgi:PEP-CTERM/exosortase A-associated glycosyltransferase
VERVDGLTVYRTPGYPPFALPYLREAQVIKHLRRRLSAIVEQERPAVLHAHSPSLNGLAALSVGRKRHLPVVYEVRALWEDAAVDQGKYKQKSFKYVLGRRIETSLLRRVDAVFTICNGLKQDICARGVPADRVTVIRNCVDSQHFSHEPHDNSLSEGLGLKGKLVLGFIGSFFDFEGLDLLLKAFVVLCKSTNDVRLLLVGDGIEGPNLRAQALELGLGDRVVFAGSVPHADVLRYYSLMDVLIYPRKSLRITELVTPLKPLEAMAMGKLVVASDVGGLRELIRDGVTGFLFRAGDVVDLAETVQRVVTRKDVLTHVGEEATRYIRERHSWSTVVSEYLPVYQRCLVEHGLSFQAIRADGD